MINTSQTISSAIETALQDLVPSERQVPCPVNPCHDPRFGDYQSNVAMALAKVLGQKPREVAQAIIAKLKVDDLCEKVEAAGAGFINFHLRKEFVARQLAAVAADSRDGIPPVPNPRRVVIDFSSPNIAKSMHVGHIRSTFLGDALARITRAVGHAVITDNHLGDWGTQFGKLIYGYKQRLNPQAMAEAPIAEFERLYKEINALSESDPQVLAAVRQELAQLQAGDLGNLAIWKKIADCSLEEFNRAYERMGVKFDHCLGESFYSPMLQKVVDELARLKLAEESDGAQCIFFRDLPELKDAAPMIIQKADGAHLYATTDLATVLYRVNEWQAEEILYVTDARQQLHFKQLFAAVNRWFGDRGALGGPPSTTREPDMLPVLKHIVFGSILGPDKKPIKTRSGESVKLADLLNEAEERARKIVQEKNPDLSEDEKKEAARVIGIGALKYADLCQNRNLDYVFDWDKLLSLQGNTAPYLVYAYVRIRSIFRKGSGDDSDEEATVPPCACALASSEELILAKHLIRFGDTVHSVLEDCRPHLLATYLYDLACKFSKFYEACPVLKAEEPTRAERLALCGLTSRVMKRGLNLMGIETLERM